MKNQKAMRRFAAVAAVAALTAAGVGYLPESAIETKAASLTGQKRHNHPLITAIDAAM